MKPVVTLDDHEVDSFFSTSSEYAPLTSSYRLGKPSSKPLLSTQDVGLILGCFILFAISFVTVRNEWVAVYLGQKFQLLVIGLCLSLMGNCSQRCLQYSLLSAETRPNLSPNRPSTIQNLDAILNGNPLRENVSTLYRAILIILFFLPLGLSAAYKTFQGGQSTTPNPLVTINVGLTGPPGTQHIGFGLSLFVNATLPWFEDPGFDRTYGFNMYVANENKTARLDGPIPSNIREIQDSLRTGETRTLEADVVAIVCEVSPTLTQSQKWLNSTFADDIQKGNPWETTYSQFVYNESFQLGLMNPNGYDFSIIWMSWWSLLKGQSFSSQARQYNLRRQWMRGTWEIAASSISLKSASFSNRQSNDTNEYIAHNWIAAEHLFISALTEYDYHFREYGPSQYTNNSKYDRYIKSDATLLASMIWARLVSLNGLEVWNTTDERSKGYSAQAKQTASITTMKRGWLLLLVLTINPALLTIAILTRTIAYSTSPVSEGFGLISMLAAVEPSSLTLLKGASLSGQLDRECPVRFRTTSTDSIPLMKMPDENEEAVSRIQGQIHNRKAKVRHDDHLQIRAVLGDEGSNDKIRRNVFYE